MPASKSSVLPKIRLKRFVNKEREDITLLLLLTLGYGLLTIAMPIAVQTLVNNVVIGGVLQPLVVVSVILFVLLFVSSVLYITEVFFVEIIQRRIFVRMTARIANNINGAKLSGFHRRNPEELMNRYFDVMTIQKSVATLLTVSLTALLQGLIGSVILMFYSIYFVAAVLVIFAVLTFIVVRLGRPALDTAIKESTTKYEMAAWLERAAKNKVLAKFFHARERTNKMADALAMSYLDAREKHFGILLKQHVGVFALYTIMGTGILVLSGMLVIGGTINIGQFVAAELIIFGVLSAFVRFVTKLGTYYDFLAALDKLGVIFDLPQEGNQTQHRLDSVTKLSVKGLSLDQENKQKAIGEINFELQKGERLAILGSTGIGKTLLAEALTGLKDPLEGSIQYNGIDLRQLDLARLRNQITLVDQIEWVEGSVLDNITLRQPTRTLDNITECLKAFGVLDDLHRLPNGLETSIDMAEQLLSRPQLKLIMLARAMVAKSQLIIIDATLDGLTEDERNQAFTGLALHESERMLIVLTRAESIAKRFEQQMELKGGLA